MFQIRISRAEKPEWRDFEDFESSCSLKAFDAWTTSFLRKILLLLEILRLLILLWLTKILSCSTSWTFFLYYFDKGIFGVSSGSLYLSGHLHDWGMCWQLHDIWEQTHRRPMRTGVTEQGWPLSKESFTGGIISYFTSKVPRNFCLQNSEKNWKKIV